MDTNQAEKDYKKRLSEEEYRILRQKGTEPPFTGAYLKNKEKGVYACKLCGNNLFSSEAKYDSGSGWPSFYGVISEDRIILREDNSLGSRRIEVSCASCGSHLGHVFPDGPKPTGQRYCINSLSLGFQKE